MTRGPTKHLDGSWRWCAVALNATGWRKCLRVSHGRACEVSALAAQFAYAIASSQAPEGPLEYKLHGELCRNTVTAMFELSH